MNEHALNYIILRKGNGEGNVAGLRARGHSQDVVSYCLHNGGVVLSIVFPIVFLAALYELKIANCAVQGLHVGQLLDSALGDNNILALLAHWPLELTHDEHLRWHHNACYLRRAQDLAIYFLYPLPIVSKHAPP